MKKRYILIAIILFYIFMLIGGRVCAQSRWSGDITHQYTITHAQEADGSMKVMVGAVLVVEDSVTYRFFTKTGHKDSTVFEHYIIFTTEVSDPLKIMIKKALVMKDEIVYSVAPARCPNGEYDDYPEVVISTYGIKFIVCKDTFVFRFLVLKG